MKKTILVKTPASLKRRKDRLDSRDPKRRKLFMTKVPLVARAGNPDQPIKKTQISRLPQVFRDLLPKTKKYFEIDTGTPMMRQRRNFSPKQSCIRLGWRQTPGSVLDIISKSLHSS